MGQSKTHWLQSPNKNYLGHWDLPDGKDLILTIESAKWEEVKNPIINKSESKRVIRFKEDIKPMICNQGNAQSIIKATGVKFMEDSKGCRIQLYVGIHKDKFTKQDIDCIRIRKEETRTFEQTLMDIETLFELKKKLLDEKEKTSIQRIIDQEETLSFDKVLKFLNSKK